MACTINGQIHDHIKYLKLCWNDYCGRVSWIRSILIGTATTIVVKLIIVNDYCGILITITIVTNGYKN